MSAMFTHGTFCRSVLLAVALLLPVFSSSARGQQTANPDLAAGIHEMDIAPVWSGHPVGFALLTHGDQQYIAYYAADRKLTVIQRTLGQKEWRSTILPTTLGWDSHNYVTMAFDRDGYLHLSGNMHAIPLIYFRSTKPGDASTLERVPSMTGQNEKSVTYPVFSYSPEGDLLFEYRSGSSGSGDTFRNRYDERTKTWKPLTDEPLFHGGTARNAYPIRLVLGPDKWYHQVWVWRESPWAETNHDMSYVRSHDLVHWETAGGVPVQLPLKLETPGIVVDDAPIRGGIINGSQSVGFDLDGKLVISYIKYDANGKTQLFFSRWQHGAWVSQQASHWDYRWDFHGGGSIPMEVMPGPLKASGGHLSIAVHHPVYGDVVWQVDPKTMQLTGDPTPEAAAENDKAAAEYAPPAGSPLSARFAGDIGGPHAGGATYRLTWNTLGANRDRPRPEGAPPPSMLRLLISK
jgi:hypothetical protein